MSFDAGALIFKIQTAGRQAFEQDQKAVSTAIDKTGASAKTAAGDTDKLGTATDNTGKKSRAAKQPLTEQADATKKVGDESARAKPKQDDQAKSTERQAEVAQRLGAALLIAGTAVTALVGLSVAKYAEFDQAMANTAAATMATAEEQRDLADAALEAGADSAYSATEAAAAQEELAKAGLSTASIIGGSLNGALALAAAGQLQVARSAEIMATTLKQYRLPAEDAAHVSDLLAAGAGKAQGSVDDLALALQYVGPVAAGLGLSLEETTGTLALFAEQGQLGERAGTGLRGVLMSLTAPSQIAARTMAEYGIEIFDADGNMKSLAAVAEIMRSRLGGLTEAERSAALGRIFGNEQITAARVLYQGGAAAVNEWTDAVDDSGYAAEQAAMRQDNLAGDVEKLGGAFDTALIKTGSGANEVLRGMVQTVTSLVDIYGEMPDEVQATALVLGIATGAALLFAGAALSITGRALEMKKNLDLANLSLTRTAVVGGAAGVALTGVIAVVALLAQQHAEARARAESYANTLEEGTNQITRATREMTIANLTAKESFLWLEGDSAADAAEKLGLSLDTVADAALGDVAALKQLNEQMDLGANGSERQRQRLDETGLSLDEYYGAVLQVDQAVRGEAESIEEAIRVQEQQASVSEEGAGITRDAAEAYLEAADGADDLNSKLQELIDTINEANGVGQDAINSNLEYQDALAQVDDTIQKAREGQEGYALTLDTSTQAGRDNKGMLVDLAEQAQQAAEAQYALDGNTDAYRQTLEGSRQALIDRATQLGYNADEAAALADQIFRIPSETEWKLLAETQDARLAADGFIRDYTGRSIPMYVTAMRAPDGRPVNTGQFADGGVVEYYAGGGIRENHVAQIAAAGTYRVWAEPETEGEGYVPFAKSKRARSEQVMSEIAERFGGVYIPAGARMFADGSAGVGTAPASPAGFEGLTITGQVELVGDGLLRFVDARISRADETSARTARQGRR